MSAPKTVVDVLDAAADLIEPEGAWTQGNLARDANGRQVGVFEPEACSYCMIGAIGKVVNAGKVYCDQTTEARAVVEELVPTSSLPTFNDNPRRTQAEVIAKLREAAQLARSREGTPT